MTAELQNITPVVRVTEATTGKSCWLTVEQVDGYGVYFQEVVDIPYRILRIAFSNNTAQDYEEGYQDGWSSAMQSRDLDDQEANKTVDQVLDELPDLEGDEPQVTNWEKPSPIEELAAREPQMGDYGYVMREDANGNRALVYDPEAYKLIAAHQ